jgi:hypothetical protein
MTERMNTERIVVLTIARDAGGATCPAEAPTTILSRLAASMWFHSRIASLTKTKK